ncbi:phosphoglycolate phosphatase [Acetitomaculum ruminis DSM 5522]|uniref:Phosphoglycolate phosphatase n=1 Tax=Acetitomaculum ruminis DSM 5522 TaxID=1120918 RepID=A0A1I0W6K3_9FIRM|nr:HAD family hydrolase [Acetitomaculum ruminis]SFA84144.1 phosphoglycolate phosphatase [Acetitomaculum ruminis DSM 5522]
MKDLAIIFDMDGTLWDSSENVALSWNEIIKKETKLNLKLTALDIQNVMGKTMFDIADALFPALSLEERRKLIEVCGIYENEYLREHGADIYEGLEEVFIKLSKNYPLYIVSNCQSGYIESFLDHYAFRKYIKDIQCFGNNKKLKADNIKLIMEKNSIKDACYVGDTQTDYDSAMEAGIDFIYAAYGFGKINTKVKTINSIKELPELLEKM